MLLKHPLHRFQWNTGCSPWRRIARRNLTGISKAGLKSGPFLAIYNDDFMPGAREIVRTRYPNDAAPKYDYSHIDSLHRQITIRIVNYCKNQAIWLMLLSYRQLRSFKQRNWRFI
ncbi:hypothetical protein BN2476_960090 [Paraburkholderia piptadeniae]|uniref:Uncharacterized protein n=1 Tax=Paraburkholderia piptadeniae TaxID=1701573 RepID=A0A1N7SVH9_9BURK|nr:hypothetical protein BN2476_960090 [Paraburkholderia piptadeniae]